MGVLVEMFGLKDYQFVKVILASTAVDKSGDKLSMKALNDLQYHCLSKTGTIEIPEYKTDCTIVNSFICSSNESDGTGEVAYNLYGILAFNAQSISGKYISDRINNLGGNLYDVAMVSFTIGASEKMNDNVRQILDVNDFVSFTFNVRSKESVRNQNRLNEVIKGTDVCPFCGSKPIVSVDRENISGLDKFRITIKCTYIECHVQPKTSFYDSSFSTACDMALKHWNQRSSDSGIVDDDLEDTDSELTKDDICINCVDCVNLKQDDDVFYCDKFKHRVRDVFTNTCESFVPQRSKAIYSFDYCDQCLSYDCGYCKKRKRETNKDLWMPCCHHSDKPSTDFKCCVNCVKCCKDIDGIYYCSLDNRFILGEHPFKHTDCDDFEQKDSDILSCVSDESVSETKEKCSSCVYADFGPDGCWCSEAESFVCTKLMNNCKHFMREKR